jgi:hypothetical protein
VPQHRFLAGIEAVRHLRQPSLAWGQPIGSPVAYWPLNLLAVPALGAAAAGIAYLVRRARRRTALRPDRIEGLAELHKIVRAVGPEALVARAAQLRPGLKRPRSDDLGYRLGTARGVACYMSVEHSAVVRGPPRSGKASTSSSR